ncbi:unnamed protein product [Rotaria sp. Silwood2]|nr:unnamed protein product [Rotaria sp. Silwood2]
MANPNSVDGLLLQEQCWLNSIRSQWQQVNLPINCLRRSKRFIPLMDVLTRSIQWLEEYGSVGDLIFEPYSEELELLAEFPDTL